MNFLKNMKNGLLTLTGAALLAASLSSTAYAGPVGLVSISSHSNFGMTVSKLKTAVSENGLMVLKVFNQQMMLNMVGVHAPKEMTFELFQPKYGKVVYDASPVDFLAVPLRILVVQTGSTAKIYDQNPSVVLDSFGLSNLGTKRNLKFQAIAATAAK